MDDDLNSDIESDPRFHIASQSRKIALDLVKLILSNARDADHARELCAQWLTTQVNVLMKETDWYKEVRTIKAAENRAKRAERPNPFARPDGEPPSRPPGFPPPPKPNPPPLRKRPSALHEDQADDDLESDTPDE